ncbi:MAG: hypothetical protein JWP25_7755 [Bradyrhizobium sp.]|jgi:hypothetical protein|nr:hypothetical protein [Bradyrhizobium sp.]
MNTALAVKMLGEVMERRGNRDGLRPEFTGKIEFENVSFRYGAEGAPALDDVSFTIELGRVLDFYEVYSVHQYGMAPALLECAECHDVQEARAALTKGFHWVLGENQLGKSMLIPKLQLSIRSQVRKCELANEEDARTARRSECIPGAFVNLDRSGRCRTSP